MDNNNNEFMSAMNFGAQEMTQVVENKQPLVQEPVVENVLTPEVNNIEVVSDALMEQATSTLNTPNFETNFGSQIVENVQPLVQEPMIETIGISESNDVEVISDALIEQATPVLDTPNFETNFGSQIVENVQPLVQEPVVQVLTPEQNNVEIGDVLSNQETPNVVKNVNNLEYNFNFETEDMTNVVENVQPLNQEPVIETVAQPEVNNIEVVNMEQADNTATPQLNEQGKPIDHELLKNLAEDTNNLVNPNMMVNSLGNQKEENVNIEEPKVDYDEIKSKRNYAFMGIVFLIILIFILLMPMLKSILGF